MARILPLSMLSVLAVVIQGCIALPDADLQGAVPLPAFRMPGSQAVSNLTAMSDLSQDIFERQSCGQGYGQCGMRF
jgi:hypothetical protein